MKPLSQPAGTLSACLAAWMLARMASAHAADAPGLEDPTRPSTSHPEALIGPQVPHDLLVEGIIHRPTCYLAIVDGRIVHAGDRLGEVLIGDIAADRVHYIRAGQEHVAYLFKNNLAVRLPTTAPREPR